MRILRKLPPHLLYTEQAGGKYAAVYEAMAKLEIGCAVEVEMADVGADSMTKLVDACHSCVSSWHARKNYTERYSCRRDNAAGSVYIVRKL